MSVGALALVIALATAGHAQVSGTVYQSGDTAFGPITAGGNCSSSLSNETPARALADTLDDAWAAAANSDGVSVALFPSGDVGPIDNNYVVSFPGTDISVEIGKYDISASDRTSVAPNSFGTLDTPGGTDPSLLIGGSEQLQDCAPKPLSLVSTGEGGPQPAGEPYWNAVGFAADQSTHDSVLLTFSESIDNFGAWFGDLETRADDSTNPGDGGELAYVKLYDETGSVLVVEPVLPNDQRAVTNDLFPPGDPGFDDDGFGCGDQDQDDDFSSCGNHGTRFLGFNWTTPDVKFMQVIVGDDDHCVEVTSCIGLTEHLSFIGPQIAIDDPVMLAQKSVINDNFGELTELDFGLDLITDPSGAATLTSHAHNELIALVSGTEYRVTETPPAGYSFNGASCVDDETGQVVTDAAGVFTAGLAGQSITCTYSNDDLSATASIDVAKTVVNDNGGTSSAADFQIGWSADGGPPVFETPPFTITSDGSFREVNVIEGPLDGTGYQQTSLVCTDQGGGQRALPITLVADDAIVCTAVNDDIAPSVTVVKQVINDDGGALASGQFLFDVAQGATSTRVASGDTVTVVAGTQVAIDEVPTEGYEQTTVTCLDVDGTDVGHPFVPDLEAAITCTVVNDDVPPPAPTPTPTATPAPTTAPTPTPTAAPSDVGPAVATPTSAPSTTAASGGSVPATGANFEILAFVGLLMLGSGAVIKMLAWPRSRL